jgi:hypothetical protein
MGGVHGCLTLVMFGLSCPPLSASFSPHPSSGRCFSFRPVKPPVSYCLALRAPVRILQTAVFSSIIHTLLQAMQNRVSFVFGKSRPGWRRRYPIDEQQSSKQ